MVGAGEEFGKVPLAGAHLLRASLRKLTPPHLDKLDPPKVL
jgi:hypothetical protein